MGSAPSKTPFDYSEDGPQYGKSKALYISNSFFFCLIQHNLEWPDYYCIIDCRPLYQYIKGHAIGAIQINKISNIEENTNGFTVVVYSSSGTHKSITEFLSKLEASGSVPTVVYIVKGSFRSFKKYYKVALNTFVKNDVNYPGPLELIPRTRNNPAVYAIHRNQFHYCKTTAAFLGCKSLLNISSRRVFLKTTAIKVDNIQFDNLNEPYDEAIAAFERQIKRNAGVMRKSSNILVSGKPFVFCRDIFKFYFT